MYDVRMHVNANGKFEAIPSTLLSQVFIYFSTFLVALLAPSLLSVYTVYDKQSFKAIWTQRLAHRIRTNTGHGRNIDSTVHVTQIAHQL